MNNCRPGVFRNHHPIGFPVSAAQKDPLLLKFRSVMTLMIRSALSSGVNVLAVSFSSGTPLALRRDRSICVFTCSQASIYLQRTITATHHGKLTAAVQLHIARSVRLKRVLAPYRTTPGCIRATDTESDFKSRASVAPAMFSAAFDMR